MKILWIISSDIILLVVAAIAVFQYNVGVKVKKLAALVA